MQWFTAISHFDKEGAIVLCKQEHNLQQQLLALPTSSLMLLRLIHRLGWTDECLVASCFRTSQNEAKAMLAFLESRHFIGRHQNYWQIEPFVVHSLKKVLNRRGWL